MRYRLRTLLILLAIGPPMVAVGYWSVVEILRPRPTYTAKAWLLLKPELVPPKLSDSKGIAQPDSPTEPNP